MALKRQVYKVNCQDGGMNGNPNLDAVPSADFIEPSKNFLLYSGGRQKRGGTSHVSATRVPVTNTQQLGIFDYQQTSGTRHTLVHGDDGKLYADYNTTPIYSALSLTAKSWFTVYQGLCIITDGSTTPRTYDGTTVAGFTNNAADWAGGDYPSVFIPHGQQASQRLWGLALGSHKFNLYASNINGTDFTVATPVKLNIDTHDGIGLIGGVEYGERLLAFGKKKAFIVLDTDPSIANWGYQDVQWEGGAAHRFLIVPTQNDVVCMTDDGDIYSVTTVINFGDYKAASIVRPSYMHMWIQNNLDLTQISKFHAQYDPFFRRIVFFVVRQGQTQVNTAMSFWIDRPLPKAWSVQDNLNFDSGYSAVSSAVVRPSAGKVQIWTGGYLGYSWKLDQSNIDDNGNPYEARIDTAPDPFSNERETKHYTAGRVVLSPAGNATLSVSYAVDGVGQGTQNIPIVISGSAFGAANYGTGIYSSIGLIEDASYNLGQIGKRISYTFYDNNVGEAIYLAEYMTDFRPLGIQP